jgi:hypothetical protein
MQRPSFYTRFPEAPPVQPGTNEGEGMQFEQIGQSL